MIAVRVVVCLAAQSFDECRSRICLLRRCRSPIALLLLRLRAPLPLHRNSKPTESGARLHADRGGRNTRLTTRAWQKNTHSSCLRKLFFSHRSSCSPSSSCLHVCPLPSSGRPRMRTFDVNTEALFGRPCRSPSLAARIALFVRHRRYHPPKTCRCASVAVFSSSIIVLSE